MLEPCRDPDAPRRRVLVFALLCALVAWGASLSACGDEGGERSGDVAANNTANNTTNNTGDGLPALEVPEGCNPLAADWDCMLPFPSDVFRVPDPALPDGHRVVLGAAAPRDEDGLPIDLPARRPTDGFSHMPPILAVFPQGVDPAPLPFHTDPIERSLAVDSPTVLLALETGERVPHFAELDPRAASDERRALIIRPLVPLEHSARYVVALRGLQDAVGAPLSPPEGFRRLRDAQTLAGSPLASLVPRYEEAIFPALASAGVARESLLLAWDFTVQSQAVVQRDMLDMRSDALSRFQEAPPAVRIDDVQEEVSPEIARRVEGVVTVPLYLTEAAPNAQLHRDDEGRVAFKGEVEVPFLMLIPPSALASEAPARVVQFGHGFFGGRGEIEGNFVYEFAQEAGVVLIATDWWGISREDQTPLGQELLLDPANGAIFVDRLHQAMINFMAVAEATRSTLLSEPAVQRGDGEPVYDPEQFYYYGISAGHIMGGTYVALSPHVDRAVFSSGGAGITFFLFRSLPFKALLFLVADRIDDALEQQKWTATFQTGVDPIDPITWARHVLRDPLPDGPSSRKVLMHGGLGDALVPNIATHLHARALGDVRLLTPSPRSVSGLAPVEAPWEGSALLEFDFGVEPSTEAADFPSSDNPVHEAVRRTPESVQHVDAFLRPEGVITHPCDGVCRLPPP